jgi:hypothetical protein
MNTWRKLALTTVTAAAVTGFCGFGTAFADDNTSEPKAEPHCGHTAILSPGARFYGTDCATTQGTGQSSVRPHSDNTNIGNILNSLGLPL